MEVIYMAENILFINACIRGKDVSRTYKLSSFFIKNYISNNKDVVLKEIALEDIQLNPLNKIDINKRDELVKSDDRESDLIKFADEFSKADTIIIAAPYWDMAFPSALKIYIEHVCVCGITFKYEADGREVGLCRAKKALYITTSGGTIAENNYGYEYVNAIFKFLGIEKTYFLSAENLDIVGNDADKIMSDAEKEAEILSEKF